MKSFDLTFSPPPRWSFTGMLLLWKTGFSSCPPPPTCRTKGVSDSLRTSQNGSRSGRGGSPLGIHEGDVRDTEQPLVGRAEVGDGPIERRRANVEVELAADLVQQRAERPHHQLAVEPELVQDLAALLRVPSPHGHPTLVGHHTLSSLRRRTVVGPADLQLLGRR